VQSSPAVAGGVVYFGSGDGNLYAVDIATGEQRWRFAALGDLFTPSSPVVADGVLYIGSYSGKVYAAGV
jgi:outer membrane protein assembly factor BamB